MSGDIRNAVRMGVLITVGSILASGLFVSAWLQLAPRVGAADIIFMAFLLPALIAPVVSFFVLRDRLRAERFARANYRLAHMDELTGLPNRRAFFDAAAQLQARAGFLGKCFFVGIADVEFVACTSVLLIGWIFAEFCRQLSLQIPTHCGLSHCWLDSRDSLWTDQILDLRIYVVIAV